MLGPKQLDELSRRILDNLPGGLAAISEDARRNVRAAAGAALARMELVTREEYDVQSAVLRRTREKLEIIEARLKELDKTLG